MPHAFGEGRACLPSPPPRAWRLAHGVRRPLCADPLIEPWSTANGCLTATQKLVSKSVYKFNAKELEVIKKKGIR